MGITSASLSISRYKVVGLSRPPRTSEFNESLAAFAAKAIRLEGVHKEDIVGWVRPVGLDNLTQHDVEHWDGADCVALDGYVLRMRQERRRVPASLLALVFQEKIYLLRKRGEKISRKEKEEIRKNVRMELLGRALPVLSFVDGFWDLSTMELIICTSAKAKKQHFETLFTQSFLEGSGAVLVSLNPPLMGLEQNLWTPSETISEDTLAWLDRIALTIPSGITETAGLVAHH